MGSSCKKRLRTLSYVRHKCRLVFIAPGPLVGYLKVSSSKREHEFHMISEKNVVCIVLEAEDNDIAFLQLLLKAPGMGSLDLHLKASPDQSA